MKQLLYIDACIRGEESRTKKIATPIMEELKKEYEVETLCLNDLNLSVVKEAELKKRLKGNISNEVLTWAYLVRDADRIVIATPFWDMSIPAALKTFFELVSIINVTFKSNDVTCYGNCKCEKLLFITTRGMNIKTGDKLDQATSYLEALSFLWGIKNVKVLARENFDYLPENIINQKIAEAIQEGLEICKDF